MDHFSKLHPLIKFTIAVPIIILILAIFIQTSRKDRLTSNTYLSYIPTNDANENDSLTGSEVLNNSFVGGGGNSISLEGPSICTYAGKDIQVDAQIKNKQIYAKVDQKKKINYFLVKEDCLYQWTEKQTSGLKICEIGQYVSMFEMFSSFLSPEMILSTISGLDSSISVPKDVVSGMLDSCKEMSIDDSVFKIPLSVSFQESNFEELQKSIE